MDKRMRGPADKICRQAVFLLRSLNTSPLSSAQRVSLLFARNRHKRNLREMAHFCIPLEHRCKEVVLQHLGEWSIKGWETRLTSTMNRQIFQKTIVFSCWCLNNLVIKKIENLDQNMATVNTDTGSDFPCIYWNNWAWIWNSFCVGVLI